MIDEDTYLEAENIQLTDEVAGKVALQLYDGATAVIHDTITVGKGTKLLISGSNIGDCSVTAKNVIHNGNMTISGHSELIAENLTVSAGADLWGMSGAMITVTNSLVVENYGDLYFTIGNVAGNANVVTLIKGYEGIDYTNVEVTSSEGYVKVVGNDNNLYAMRGDSSTLYANAAWTGHEPCSQLESLTVRVSVAASSAVRVRSCFARMLKLRLFAAPVIPMMRSRPSQSAKTSPSTPTPSLLPETLN